MPTRLAPLALVMLAACEPGGGAGHLPPAVAPHDLLREALESPGDGSDILEALAEFESTETWRKAPAGLVISDRTLQAIASAPDQDLSIGKRERRPTPSSTGPADARALRASRDPLQEEARTSAILGDRR